MLNFRRILRIIKKCGIYLKDIVFPPTNSEINKRKAESMYSFLQNKGVVTEIGWVEMIGTPIIDKFKNSDIVIGKGVVLVSDVTYNQAGINHPVIISTMAEGAKIVLHDGVGISGGSIVTTTSIEVGENTMLGVNCNIWGTDFHSVNSEERLCSNGGGRFAKQAPIKIGKNCWLGANVTILKGVTIGDCVVIGAGSVVTKDVPSNTMVAGNPAKIVRKL